MSLIDELKRRNVFKAGAAYLALGWVVTQVTSTVAPVLHMPEWIASVVVWIGVIGFPFVIMFSWIYELTPEGLKRENQVDRTTSITHVTSRRLDHIIIGLLVLAIGLFAFDRFSPRKAEPVAASDEATTPAIKSAAAPSTAAASPAASDSSIAVLPFVDMSQSKDQEYFSDGLSEELLNLLAQIPQLRVIARTSSFSFKGKEVDVAEIAKTLNVANVLEGSVRKSGDTLRITAQLIRTADSSHLWSETYDRQLTDVFKVQDEIAAAVVAQLKVKLLPAQQVTNPHRTANTEAYNQYLLGNQFFNRNSLEGYHFAVDGLSEGHRARSRLRRGIRRARLCGNLHVGLCSDARRKCRRTTTRTGCRGQVDCTGAGSGGRLRGARLAALVHHLGMELALRRTSTRRWLLSREMPTPSVDTASC